jgi:hypothetical protein
LGNKEKPSQFIPSLFIERKEEWKGKIKNTDFTIPTKTKIMMGTINGPSQISEKIFSSYRLSDCLSEKSQDKFILFDHTNRYYTNFHRVGDYLISVFPPHNGGVVKGPIGIEYVDCQRDLLPYGKCECPSGIHSHLRIKREALDKNVDLVLRFINEKSSEHTFMFIGTCADALWMIHRLPIKLV